MCGYWEWGQWRADVMGSNMITQILEYPRYLYSHIPTILISSSSSDLSLPDSSK